MAVPANIRAVIFDVEGTLVDCASLVLESWRSTLAGAGYSFDLDQLQPYSGMDGEWMLEQLLPHATGEQRKHLLKTQGDLYRNRYIENARAFAGVPELFNQLAQRGIKLAIATTCKRDELQIYDKQMRVVRNADTVACGETVKHGKPDPSLLRYCLEHLRIASPGCAVAVGDTPFDAEAAKAVGAHCVAVRTGGFTDNSLLRAGHEKVLDEVRDLIALWGIADALTISR